MICDNKYTTINLIQGDTLEVNFIIEDLEFADEARVFFVCNALGIKEELPPYNLQNEDDGDDSDWVDETIRILRIDDTTEMRIGEFEYDLMAEEDGIDRVTYIYHGTVKIQPRWQHRREGYNPYYEYPHNTRHTPAPQKRTIPSNANIVGGIGYDNEDPEPHPDVPGFGWTED